MAVDVSNRPYLVYQLALENDRIGSFDASLTEDFMYAFSQSAGLDLHIEKRYGKSPHHVVEAAFKGVARALRAKGIIPPARDFVTRRVRRQRGAAEVVAVQPHHGVVGAAQPQLEKVSLQLNWMFQFEFAGAIAALFGPAFGWHDA